MTPSDVVAVLDSAGISATVAWASGSYGSVTVRGGLSIIVQNGLASVSRKSAADFGHGIAGINGPIVSPYVQNVEAALNLVR